MAEVEKVKKRREEREAEREAVQQDLELMQRERTLAEAVDLERKEEQFHLEQASTRSLTRLQEGRPKPVDLISSCMLPLEGIGPAEKDPNEVIGRLGLYQLRELKRDLAEMGELDGRDLAHAAFWAAAEAVTEHVRAEAQKQEDLDRAK
jgi:hypothetical protein